MRAGFDAAVGGHLVPGIAARRLQNRLGRLEIVAQHPLSGRRGEVSAASAKLAASQANRAGQPRLRSDLRTMWDMTPKCNIGENGVYRT